MNKNKELSRALMGKIERIPQFEEKLGLVYENSSINANIDEKEINIFADLRVVDDNKFNRNNSIETTVTLYDEDNFILDMSKNYLSVSDFLGLETLNLYYKYNPDYRFEDIVKIRILPK